MILHDVNETDCEYLAALRATFTIATFTFQAFTKCALPIDLLYVGKNCKSVNNDKIGFPIAKALLFALVPPGTAIVKL
jgi:hypothetical protein